MAVVFTVHMEGEHRVLLNFTTTEDDETGSLSFADLATLLSAQPMKSIVTRYSTIPVTEPDSARLPNPKWEIRSYLAEANNVGPVAASLYYNIVTLYPIIRIGAHDDNVASGRVELVYRHSMGR